jgi:hypothetical protein
MARSGAIGSRESQRGRSPQRRGALGRRDALGIARNPCCTAGFGQNTRLIEMNRRLGTPFAAPPRSRSPGRRQRHWGGAVPRGPDSWGRRRTTLTGDGYDLCGRSEQLGAILEAPSWYKVDAMIRSPSTSRLVLAERLASQVVYVQIGSSGGGAEARDLACAGG